MRRWRAAGGVMIAATLLLCSCSAARGRAKTSFAARWNCPEDELVVTKVAESFERFPQLPREEPGPIIDNELYSVSGCGNQGEYWAVTDTHESRGWLHTTEISGGRDFTAETLEQARRAGGCQKAAIRSRRSCPPSVDRTLRTLLVLDCDGQDRSFTCLTSPSTEHRAGRSSCEGVSDGRLECL